MCLCWIPVPGAAGSGPRRPRYSARTVKCSTSRYHEHDDSRPRLSLPPPSLVPSLSPPGSSPVVVVMPTFVMMPMLAT